MDLLNQPDMLSAFLGPSQEDNEWGSSSNPYHTRNASYHEDFEYDLQPTGDNVDGNMEIPEQEPYTEPEPMSYPPEILVRTSLTASTATC